jgi:hypothetical protein
MPGQFSDAVKQARGNVGAINVLSALRTQASAIAVSPRPPIFRPPGFDPHRPWPPHVDPPPSTPPHVDPPPSTPPHVDPPPSTPPPASTPPGSSLLSDPAVQQLAASLLTGILTVVVKSLQGELDPDKIDLDQLFVKSPTELLRERGITQDEIDRILG